MKIITSRAKNCVGLFVSCVCLAALASCGSGGSSGGGAVEGRVQTISLNGDWRVAQGGAGDIPPADFDRTVPVPGFVDLAEPPFLDVGIPSERRDAFWYRRDFSIPEGVGPVAILKLGKVKYGAEVWLNGASVGSHLGAFSLAEMDVSEQVVRGGTNTVTVRVGADKLQVPATVPTGEDLEKHSWFPGIWDDVTIAFSAEQRVVRVKIEPDVQSGEVVILTTIFNHAGRPRDVAVSQEVRESRSGVTAAARNTIRVRLGVGEATFSQRIGIPDAQWWSPESPFLYTVRTEVSADGTESDELETRFGMRSVEWRSGDEPGFFLNGQRYYLRGSNLSLHRFFQHEARGALPWDRAWVRRLLSTNPSALHWNSMRVSIGRLPNLWYDLADEIGILLADEFMMWSLVGESARWSIDEMEKEYRAWVQENWNHPSIGWWDASNETSDPKSTAVVERVRDLDPTRQWENGGHNLPQGPDDPVEEHSYVLFGIQSFQELPTFVRKAPLLRLTASAPGHPYVLNEFNLLWLQSDGFPFRTSERFYEAVPRMINGPYTRDEYREAYAYVGSVLTEFWRAHRIYSGVQHFTYITSSPVTSDNFIDLRELTLEPRWERYASDAFAPVAVHLDFWDEDFASREVDVPLIVINDTPLPRPVDIELLAVDVDGTVLQRSLVERVEIPALGEATETMAIRVPSADRWVLFARMQPLDDDLPTTWSRRKIGFDHLGEPIPDPPFAAGP